MNFNPRSFGQTPNDIFSNLFGRESYRQTYTNTFYDTILPAAAVLSAGILVGASVALLVAPKPGHELREDITNRFGSRESERGLPGRVRRSSEEVSGRYPEA